MEEPRATPQPVVTSLPDDIYCWIFCCLLFFFFLWRIFRSVRSQLYKKLAIMFSGLIEEKCKLHEKFSLVQTQYESYEVQSSLMDASFKKEATEVPNLEATLEKLNRSNSELQDEIPCLIKELKEEKSKHSEQDELTVDISKRLQSLEYEPKSLKSQVAEIAIKDALTENNQLQENQKQLLQEAEVWKEQVSELNKQKITFETSKVHAEQDLKDKENHIKILTECLLRMNDWATMLGEDVMDDDNLELEMNSESENDAYLDNPPKGVLKKRIHVAKKQIYIQLAEVNKTKEELTEHIKNLQTEQASLQSENTHFESETQKLRQRLKVMTELYHENEMKLHGKLTAEENYHHDTEETIHYYQGQITSYEKKAHDNWLAARTAERMFKFELLVKDPYELDVLNTAFERTLTFDSRGRKKRLKVPGNPLNHQIINEREESSCVSLTSTHRDRRIVFPPPRQSYPDSALPPQRQDRFYSNSGRLSGPAELRSFNMPSLDKMDGSIPLEMESCRNDTKDDLGNNLNVPDSSLPRENEATGSGFVPPPLAPIKGPLFPVDTRRTMFGASQDYFPLRDFPGPPHAPFAMRNVYPLRNFLPYLPPRLGFPPYPHILKIEGLILPSNEPAVEHPEPQQET
uniref:MIA SH3 domain ER export factor 2 n=1 Tax=Saimiri boliviensis boliviensis TaxID=39432 RepID=A0A2K6TFB8_SAIBB